MLIISDGQVVAAVDFLDEIVEGVTYRYRCYWLHSGKEFQGKGVVFEEYRRAPAVNEPDTYDLVDSGSQLQITAGPIHLTWSHGGDGAGWIYYTPEEMNVQIAHERDFEAIKLIRFK